MEAAQQRVLAGDTEAAAAVLTAAIDEHPVSIELGYALAGALSDRGESAAAEARLRRVLDSAPGHAPASLMLARLLDRQGRTAAVGRVLRDAFDGARHDVELTIQALELLDNAGRKRDAAALCEAHIGAGSTDVRLYAYAGMLLAQLGEFALARQRYEFVAEHSEQAPDWHVPQGLAGLQRYRDRQHPDFAPFQRFSQRPLSDAARTSLLFALGKAHDDIGDIPAAVDYFRQANALAGAINPWSRKPWRRSVQERRRRTDTGVSVPAADDWVPVFIIGLPRSGSTLLAERLARHRQVFHRGELPWLPILAERLERSGRTSRAMAEAAALYTAQLRQDDTDARWLIDKQPTNTMHVDLILALFPQARIVYCQRDARDNAVSLWMQPFQRGSQAFAYDLADIAAVIRGTAQLMDHWRKTLSRRHPHRALRRSGARAGHQPGRAGAVAWAAVGRHA